MLGLFRFFLNGPWIGRQLRSPLEPGKVPLFLGALLHGVSSKLLHHNSIAFVAISCWRCINARCIRIGQGDGGRAGGPRWEPLYGTTHTKGTGGIAHDEFANFKTWDFRAGAWDDAVVAKVYACNAGLKLPGEV